jgi:polyvinyl alcohol dehydrogenase (cytochrome)
MTPERIYDALTTGAMQSQAQGLSDAAKRGIAEYLGDRKLGAGESGSAERMSNRCEVSRPAVPRANAGDWNGWGADLSNTRYQPARAAGLPAVRVPQLTLKWAFAVPGATAVYGQPTAVDGRVFVGADTGYMYALDQRTGCVQWSFQAQAGVRSAVTVGPLGTGRRGAFFGDLKGNVYSVDAATGALVWTMRADGHALARITASPVLYRDRLYISVASFEEGASTSPKRCAPTPVPFSGGPTRFPSRRCPRASRRPACRCSARRAAVCGTRRRSTHAGTRSTSAPATTTRVPSRPRPMP